jgi:membrane associated rhomboid family serine protease
MTLISFILVSLDGFFGGLIGQFLAIRFTAWSDPLMYVRMFTHVLAHQGLTHFVGNYMLILAIGPIVEEKYTTKRLVTMIAVTAFITGILNVIFFRNVMLLGASGIVFMLILLASFVNMKQGHIPLTVILVAILYIGNEIVQGITTYDNVSQAGHIIGGLCGAAFGFFLHRNEK